MYTLAGCVCVCVCVCPWGGGGGAERMVEVEEGGQHDAIDKHYYLGL